jgi:hypothetical protein
MYQAVLQIRDPEFFYPWIRDTGWDPESRMNIPDLIFENLVSVFGLKILKFFDADPDSGWEKSDLG